MSDPKVIADYAALAFLRYLEQRYPGVKWERVYPDDESETDSADRPGTGSTRPVERPKP